MRAMLASGSSGSSHSNHPRIDLWLQAGKLVLFLCLLPLASTYWHLRHELYHSVIRDWLVLSGTHAPGIYGRSEATGNFYKLVWRRGDVMAMAHSLSSSPVAYSGRPYVVPALDRPDGIPCLHKADESMICSKDMIVDLGTTSTPSLEPASLVGRNSNATLRQLQDPSRHNPKSPSSHGLSFIWHCPATSLLIGVNVLAAALYWNGHVPVSHVALVYPALVGPPYEVWRTLTGPVSHFELWHLGLNMMSLSALGRELEGTIRTTTNSNSSVQRYVLFSSISFFLYNLSLIPIVAGLWWLLQRAILKYVPTSHSSRFSVAALVDANRPTVGYSGVLFAWMVVASLEQPTTCPIVFLPNVCFTTYSWWGGLLKFNVAPLIQLVVLQVLLPRVSLTGHLAGILAGFLVHWGLLPLSLVHPVLLMPWLYMAYLKWIRNIIPAAALTVDSLSERSTNTGSPDDVAQRAFALFRGQLLTLFLSSTFLGLFSSLTLSFAGTILYWHCLRHSLNRTGDDPTASTSTATVFAKGYVVAAVGVLVWDAMTVGSWLALSEANIWAVLMVLIRACVLLASLVTVQECIPPESTGVFEWTLGFTTLQPCRTLASHALTQWTVTSGTHASGTSTNSPAPVDVEAAGSKFVPFSGGGNRLGR